MANEFRSFFEDSLFKGLESRLLNQDPASLETENWKSPLASEKQTFKTYLVSSHDVTFTLRLTSF